MKLRLRLYTLLIAIAVLFHVSATRGAVTLYLSSGNAQIDAVSSTGVVTPFAFTPGSHFGLAFDTSGNLYAANWNFAQIDKITPSGTVSLFATVGPAGGPTGLAFDTGGNLYVTNNGSGQISKITPGGVVSTFATLPATSYPFGLAFDPDGNLYVAEARHQISMITPGGTVSTFATGLSNPTFIASRTEVRASRRLIRNGRDDGSCRGDEALKWMLMTWLT